MLQEQLKALGIMKKINQLWEKENKCSFKMVQLPALGIGSAVGGLRFCTILILENMFFDSAFLVKHVHSIIWCRIKFCSIPTNKFMFCVQVYC